MIRNTFFDHRIIGFVLSKLMLKLGAAILTDRVYYFLKTRGSYNLVITVKN